MERLAETVRKVAVVGFERVGKRVALSLEHQPNATIIVENLINRSCTTVGRNEQAILFLRYFPNNFYNIIKKSISLFKGILIKNCNELNFVFAFCKKFLVKCT